MQEALPHEGHVARVHARAFEDFYATQWQEIYRPLAVTLRDPDLAQEATDEAMVRAYQKWRTVRHYANPAGWTYRVGLNWAISQLRRRKRLVHAKAVSNNPTWDPPPADPSISQALSHLPIEQRAVVVLRYLCDETQAEIAADLDIPVGTVRSRLSRALNRLREEVSA
ncbi:RNA polymerase sigma factor [Actinomycetota bacterium]